MIIDCVSDLHGHFPKLEGGDLLIVAGDLTAGDNHYEHEYFCDWLDFQSYTIKIVIAGNHDNNIDPDLINSTYRCSYLQDSSIEFEGLNIWGSPWTTRFKGMNPHCMAFTVETEEELADKFTNIPHNTDILITHSPPYGILDKTRDERNVGSVYLYNWFKYCERPKLHVFGHIHEAHGQDEFFAGYNNIPVKSVNASHVNEFYQPVNNPIRIHLNETVSHR